MGHQGFPEDEGCHFRIGAVVQEKIQGMECIPPFSFLDMSVKMQGQTCNSLCNYSDTGINRRRLHGIFLRHLFSGRRRSKEKPEHRRFGQLRFIPAFE
jgi:hypothetical protein